MTGNKHPEHRSLRRYVRTADVLRRLTWLKIKNADYGQIAGRDELFKVRKMRQRNPLLGSVAPRRLVDDKTYFSNRLIAQLKLYYPQILRWFYKPASPVACDFLLRWPTLEVAQKATPRALKAFFSKHSCQDVERRMEEIRKAVSATHDQAVIRSAMIMVEATVRLLQAVHQDIGHCEERIGQLTKSHPDFAIFDSLPDAGDALIPRLIAALGTQRDRFASAVELQSYSGVAPVVKQSGNTKLTHCRQAYPRFLRQTFHEWALHHILKATWARAYYERQRSRGKKHHTAIRALAYKWIRILYRCLKDRVPYVESSHADAQKKSPP